MRSWWWGHWIERNSSRLSAKVVGAGLNEIVAKYKGDADAQSDLAAKVRAGGQGVWGPVPMPPNVNLQDDDIRALVKWIPGGAG